jgi:hypothetical protein
MLTLAATLARRSAPMKSSQRANRQLALSLQPIRVDPKIQKEVIRNTAELLLEALRVKATRGKEASRENR